mmetsp:Transcript_55670/g.162782  ORF Transcript_55670/g.162782 Transcript_55670/m.162782 type:complete len:90 (-) Transcript_55670:86-355(-)
MPYLAAHPRGSAVQAALVCDWLRPSSTLTTNPLRTSGRRVCWDRIAAHADKDLDDIDDSQSDAGSWEDGSGSEGDFDDGPERPWVNALD